VVRFVILAFALVVTFFGLVWISPSPPGNGYDFARDLVDYWSKIISSAGFILAGISAVIAYFTFELTATGARQAHMHSLFRDYLRLRVEIETNQATLSASSSISLAQINNRLNASLISFKLYTLEEMLQWTHRERTRTWLNKRRSKSYIDGWEATIVHHLHENAEATIASLIEYDKCYGDEFIRFAADTLRDDEGIRQLAQRRLQ
jgi:hypothetical protein